MNLGGSINGTSADPRRGLSTSPVEEGELGAGNGLRRRGVVSVAVAVAVTMVGVALAAARVIRIGMLAAVLDDRADMPTHWGNSFF